MLTIDGSFGEGGGQILRSSLALSMVTGTPFRIEKIRAGRSRPGLMRQHLTSVQAAAKVSQADVRGDSIGSSELAFAPNEVVGGNYTFSVGTAGSTTLVLQTVLLPLLMAKKPSRLTLEGGTHNPFAPPFDFLSQAYLPVLTRMGAKLSASLERPGFYPAGGGRIVVEVEPVSELGRVDLLERGPLCSRRAEVYIASLPRHIAEREMRTIIKVLGWKEEEVGVSEIANSNGPGNVVTISLNFEQVSEVFAGFGEQGRSAEAVATQAIHQCQRYLKGTAPVSDYLTDQLLLPFALARAGSFLSSGLNRHAETHVDLIHQFLPVRIQTNRRENGEVVVEVKA